MATKNNVIDLNTPLKEMYSVSDNAGKWGRAVFNGPLVTVPWPTVSKSFALYE